MGSDQTLKHFGHPHLLEISAHQKTKNAATKCSACKFDAAGWICTCKRCNYLIHFQCSQIPQQIQLPFHKEHILSLISESARRSGTFTCRACACNKGGDGFSYSCTDCNVHIHILCAILPQIVTHENHEHPLDLEFCIPDGTNKFRCGICQTSGANHWLYRCKQCRFHAHVGCATPKPTFAFSSSATGTNNVSDRKGSPNSAQFKGPSYGHYDDISQRGEFDIGSNSVTGTSKANDKNRRSSSTSSFKGHDDNDIRSNQPGGSDAHSGGTTRKQKFGGSNSATGTGKPSNEKGSVNSATPKGSPYETEYGSGDDDDNEIRSSQPGPGGSDPHSGGTTRKQTFGGSNSATGTGKPSNEKASVNSAPPKGSPHETKACSGNDGEQGQGGDDAHPGSKTPRYNDDTSDSDSDDNDDVIDYRNSKK